MSVLNRRPNPHNFDPSTSIPPLTSRVVLVTGGNAGIGLQTVLQLSHHDPARIYLACRSRAKYDTALTEILKSNAKAKDCVAYLELDLTSFDSIKAAAKTVLEENDRLDLLINNAGVMGAPPGQTKEGYEMHFGVNYLGHCLLTKLLLPLLQRTAARADVEKASVRVVNVSSMAWAMAPRTQNSTNSTIDLSPATIKSDGSSKHSHVHYRVSKLANILFAKEAARRWGESGVISVSVHPGRVATTLLDGFHRENKWDFWTKFQQFYDVVIGAMTPEEGAWTQVWAATAPFQETEGGINGKGQCHAQGKEGVMNGAFYIPIGVRGDEGSMAKRMNDEAAARGLWEWMERELAEHGVE